MKRNFKLLAMLSVVATTAFMTSCSSEDDFLDNPSQSGSQTRAVTNYVIDFEDAGSAFLAGPTSYGENLYGGGFQQWTHTVVRGKTFVCGINQMGGAYNYYNGGIAIANWNIMANPEGKTGDWWYSYLNQCSVYNTQSVSGSNAGAGNGGSNKFGVMYGYSDSFNASYMSNPEFYFDNKVQFTIEKMYICNSSYSYGVMVNGNKFGIYGEAVSLEKAKGWFKVLAYGYDANGNATNGGKPVEKYICDYRDSSDPKISLKTTWEEWNLSALGAVNKVKFNFEGSDSGAYGLNSPAYLCIDDIHIYQ